MAVGEWANSNLPSWVPDLRLSKRQFLPKRNTNESGRFNAAGCIRPIFLKRDSSPEVIAIGGIRCDKIASISSPLVLGLGNGSTLVSPDLVSYWKFVGENEEELARS